MNPRPSSPSKKSADSCQNPLAPLILDWRQSLDACSRKPGKGRVHALRVITRRIEAALHLWSLAHEGERQAIVEKWLKQAKKLRRALGRVRECDVLLDRLNSMRQARSPAAENQVNTTRRLQQERVALKKHLQLTREKSAADLVEYISDRRKNLKRHTEAIENLFCSTITPRWIASAQPVKNLLAEIAAEFASPEASTLHALRLRIKEARYQAEMCTGDEPRRLAETLRRMQVAIGEWHDDRLLARQAKHTHTLQLSTVLQAQASQSLRKALKVIRLSLPRLVQPAEKIPPKSVASIVRTTRLTA